MQINYVCPSSGIEDTTCQVDDLAMMMLLACHVVHHNNQKGWFQTTCDRNLLDSFLNGD